MPLSINTIKPAVGAKKNRKRVGRGNSSGHGTYSGRGQKGQKSRAGVSNLKRLGMRQVLLRIPKNRGFKSLKADNQVINLSDLNKHFKDGESVNSATLASKGLIVSAFKATKVLGLGELKVKNLVFKNLQFSDSAKEQITKMNGKIE